MLQFIAQPALLISLPLSLLNLYYFLKCIQELLPRIPVSQ